MQQIVYFVLPYENFCGINICILYFLRKILRMRKMAELNMVLGTAFLQLAFYSRECVL